MAAKEYTTFGVDGHELRLSSPSKADLPARDGRPPITKLDLAKQSREPTRAPPSRARQDA